MIILDTNVVSEPLRPAPDTNVLAWLDQQDIATMYLTTITLAELRHGIAALPDGKRRRQLQAAMDERIEPLFSGRILAFDEAAARAYASVRLHARDAGKAISAADSYIAAIAAERGFTVATRDGTPFRAAGIRVVDPWTAVG